MAGLDDLLDDFYEKIKGKMSFTPDQKAEITGAGAKAYAKVLKKNTPKSTIDYSQGPIDVGKSGQKTSHLRDDLQYKPGISDGFQTGDTDISFGEKNDFLVRIINDGLKRNPSPKEQANQHFLERSQSESRDDIAKAMDQKMNEVLRDD